ncbi:hypothetical protein LIER_25705 [Lithospermum erythrorhizon]|uniref:Uncharacterized protein n=1 Tax=Lithospermum erythrorhizon TaxID=34254 RepID=A0AAV3R9G1_LITER
MTWVIRKVRRLFTEDCVQVLCEGTIIDVDWLNLNLFDLKNVDEFSLRSGYDVGSRHFYAYKEPEMERICGLKPLLCDDDVVQFRELTTYDISCEYPNFGYREDELCQIRLGDDDIKFFRDGDGFDVELDDEIGEETMAQKKEMLDKKWQKLDKNRILGLDELVEGIESSSQSKKKIPRPYARHGLKFKIRRETGYTESSTDAEDSILSDCELDDSLNSRANSNDEKDQEVQTTKDVRYVKFNKKNM